MIVAALTLLGVGTADVIRSLARGTGRWIGWGVLLGLILALAALADAPFAAPVAGLTTAAWVWLVPDQGRARAGFWPAVGLALVCAVAVLGVGARADEGIVGDLHVATPGGSLSFEQVLLACGIIVFLFESANAVVRIALAGEGVTVLRSQRDEAGSLAESTRTADSRADGTVETASTSGSGASVTPDRALRGGRLIGPLERLLVFSLTLAGAYPLLAAFIAAKGIVRFPEISKDSEWGNRAEYFLIGSLVSWVIGLAGAFLLWWALGS